MLKYLTVVILLICISTFNSRFVTEPKDANTKKDDTLSEVNPNIEDDDEFSITYYDIINEDSDEEERKHGVDAVDMENLDERGKVERNGQDYGEDSVDAISDVYEKVDKKDDLKLDLNIGSLEYDSNQENFEEENDDEGQDYSEYQVDNYSDVAKGNDYNDLNIKIDGSDDFPTNEENMNINRAEASAEGFDYSEDSVDSNNAVKNKNKVVAGEDYSDPKLELDKGSDPYDKIIENINSKIDIGDAAEESNNVDTGGVDYADNLKINDKIDDGKNTGEDYDHIDANENREIEIEDMVRYDINDKSINSSMNLIESGESKNGGNDYGYEVDSYDDSDDLDTHNDYEYHQMEDELYEKELGNKDKTDKDHYYNLGLYDEYSDNTNGSGMKKAEPYVDQEDVNGNKRYTKVKNNNDKGNDYNIGSYETYYDNMGRKMGKGDNSYEAGEANSIEDSNDYSDDDSTEYSEANSYDYSDTDSNEYSAIEYEEESAVDTDIDPHMNNMNTDYKKTETGNQVKIVYINKILHECRPLKHQQSINTWIDYEPKTNEYEKANMDPDIDKNGDDYYDDNSEGPVGGEEIKEDNHKNQDYSGEVANNNLVNTHYNIPGDDNKKSFLIRTAKDDQETIQPNRKNHSNNVNKEILQNDKELKIPTLFHIQTEKGNHIRLKKKNVPNKNGIPTQIEYFDSEKNKTRPQFVKNKKTYQKDNNKVDNINLHKPSKNINNHVNPQIDNQVQELDYHFLKGKDPNSKNSKNNQMLPIDEELDQPNENKYDNGKNLSPAIEKLRDYEELESDLNIDQLLNKHYTDYEYAPEKKPPLHFSRYYTGNDDDPYIPLINNQKYPLNNLKTQLNNQLSDPQEINHAVEYLEMPEDINPRNPVFLTNRKINPYQSKDYEELIDKETFENANDPSIGYKDYKDLYNNRAGETIPSYYNYDTNNDEISNINPASNQKNLLKNRMSNINLPRNGQVQEEILNNMQQPILPSKVNLEPRQFQNDVEPESNGSFENDGNPSYDDENEYDPIDLAIDKDSEIIQPLDTDDYDVDTENDESNEDIDNPYNEYEYKNDPMNFAKNRAVDTLPLMKTGKYYKDYYNIPNVDSTTNKKNTLKKRMRNVNLPRVHKIKEDILDEPKLILPPNRKWDPKQNEKQDDKSEYVKNNDDPSFNYEYENGPIDLANVNSKASTTNNRKVDIDHYHNHEEPESAKGIGKTFKEYDPELSIETHPLKDSKVYLKKYDTVKNAKNKKSYSKNTGYLLQPVNEKLDIKSLTNHDDYDINENLYSNEKVYSEYDPEISRNEQSIKYLHEPYSDTDDNDVPGVNSKKTKEKLWSKQKPMSKKRGRNFPWDQILEETVDPNPVSYEVIFDTNDMNPNNSKWNRDQFNDYKDPQYYTDIHSNYDYENSGADDNDYIDDNAGDGSNNQNESLYDDENDNTDQNKDFQEYDQDDVDNIKNNFKIEGYKDSTKDYSNDEIGDYNNLGQNIQFIDNDLKDGKKNDIDYDKNGYLQDVTNDNLVDNVNIDDIQHNIKIKQFPESSKTRDQHSKVVKPAGEFATHLIPHESKQNNNEKTLENSVDASSKILQTGKDYIEDESLKNRNDNYKSKRKYTNKLKGKTIRKDYNEDQDTYGDYADEYDEVKSLENNGEDYNHVDEDENSNIEIEDMIIKNGSTDTYNKKPSSKINSFEKNKDIDYPSTSNKEQTLINDDKDIRPKKDKTSRIDKSGLDSTGITFEDVTSFEDNGNGKPKNKPLKIKRTKSNHSKAKAPSKIGNSKNAKDNVDKSHSNSIEINNPHAELNIKDNLSKAKKINSKMNKAPFKDDVSVSSEDIDDKDKSYGIHEDIDNVNSDADIKKTPLKGKLLKDDISISSEDIDAKDKSHGIHEDIDDINSDTNIKKTPLKGKLLKDNVSVSSEDMDDKDKSHGIHEDIDHVNSDTNIKKTPLKGKLFTDDVSVNSENIDDNDKSQGIHEHIDDVNSDTNIKKTPLKQKLLKDNVSVSSEYIDDKDKSHGIHEIIDDVNSDTNVKKTPLKGKKLKLNQDGSPVKDNKSSSSDSGDYADSGEDYDHLDKDKNREIEIEEMIDDDFNQPRLFDGDTSRNTNADWTKKKPANLKDLESGEDNPDDTSNTDGYHKKVDDAKKKSSKVKKPNSRKNKKKSHVKEENGKFDDIEKQSSEMKIKKTPFTTTINNEDKDKSYSKDFISGTLKDIDGKDKSKGIFKVVNNLDSEIKDNKNKKIEKKSQINQGEESLVDNDSSNSDDLNPNTKKNQLKVKNQENNKGTASFVDDNFNSFENEDVEVKSPNFQQDNGSKSPSINNYNPLITDINDTNSARKYLESFPITNKKIKDSFPDSDENTSNPENMEIPTNNDFQPNENENNDSFDISEINSEDIESPFYIQKESNDYNIDYESSDLTDVDQSYYNNKTPADNHISNRRKPQLEIKDYYYYPDIKDNIDDDKISQLLPIIKKANEENNDYSNYQYNISPVQYRGFNGKNSAHPDNKYNKFMDIYDYLDNDENSKFKDYTNHQNIRNPDVLREKEILRRNMVPRNNDNIKGIPIESLKYALQNSKMIDNNGEDYHHVDKDQNREIEIDDMMWENAREPRDHENGVNRNLNIDLDNARQSNVNNQEREFKPPDNNIEYDYDISYEEKAEEETPRKYGINGLMNQGKTKDNRNRVYVNTNHIDKDNLQPQDTLKQGRKSINDGSNKIGIETDIIEENHETNQFEENSNDSKQINLDIGGVKENLEDSNESIEIRIKVMEEDSEEDTEDKIDDQDDENKGVLVMENNKLLEENGLNLKIRVIDETAGSKSETSKDQSNEDKEIQEENKTDAKIDTEQDYTDENNLINDQNGWTNIY